jgi:hypothetical protein
MRPWSGVATEPLGGLFRPILGLGLPGRGAGIGPDPLLRS